MSSKWGSTTLREAAEFRFSNVDKHIVHGEASVRLCNYLDVYRNRKLTATMPYSEGSARPGEIKRFAVQKGDVIITKDSETADDIGVPALVVDDLPNTICGYHLAIIRPNGEIDPRFLALFLQTDPAKRHFLRFANGVTRFGLGLRAIGTLPVPVPPPDEQCAIADILDALDVATEETRAAITASGRLVRALVQSFFEQGLGRISSADRPGKTLRKGWRLVPTNQLLVRDPKNGVSPVASPQPPGYPTFSIAAVRNGKIDLMNEEHLKYVRIRDEVAAEFALNRGDLLIVRGNANPELVGRCGMVADHPEGCIYPDILKRVVFRDGDDGLIPEYACIAWNYPVVHNQVLKLAKTSNGTLKINSKDVKQIIMPVPPKQEQEQLVELAGRAEKSLQCYQRRAFQLEQLKRGLMQDLLTGRVRVKLPAHSGNGVVRSRP